MQTFVGLQGDWNKYPVLPWFALGMLGSVMAVGWFGGWKTVKRRILMSWGIGLAAIAVGVRRSLRPRMGQLDGLVRTSHRSRSSSIRSTRRTCSTTSGSSAR